MQQNNKGFSLVEILAMIIITTAIIFPLLTTLIDSFEINRLMHDRRSAITVSETTVYAFDKMNFSDLRNQVNDANDITNKYYIDFDVDKCINLTVNDDETLCGRIFDSIWNNVNFDKENFRVFIFNYNLTADQIRILSEDMTDIPKVVRDKIALIPENLASNDNLLRIEVYIRYADGELGTTTLSGYLYNE